MVRVKIEIWEIYYVFESPHKDRNMCVYVSEGNRCNVYSHAFGALQLLQP